MAADGSITLDTKIDSTGLSSGVVALGNLASSALQKVSSGLVNGFKYAVNAGMEFDSSMSQLAATMGTTVGEIQNLENFARQMGATTVFSAKEAADGLNILAMAGLDADQQMAALPSVLNLASAGQLSLAQASSYVTATVKGFGDEMGNSQKYVDLMAKGATMANTDVNSLGIALSDCSNTAHNYGQSAEGVTLSLLRLAEGNMTGSEAGTALSRMMSQVFAPSSQKARDALEELGVSAYDASGKERDFTDIIADLEVALSGCTNEQKNQYLQTIFGMRYIDVYNKLVGVSTERVDEFADGIAHASDGMGAAAQQAQTQNDNLNGSLKMLESALQDLCIQFESTVRDGLNEFIKAVAEWARTDQAKEMVQQLADKLKELMNNVLAHLPEIIQAIISLISGLPALIGGIVNVITFVAEHIDAIVAGIKVFIGIWAAVKAFNIVSSIVNVIKNIINVGKAISTVVSSIGILSNPITLIIAAIAAVIAAVILLWNNCEGFRNGVTAIWEGIKGAFITAGQAIVAAWNGIGQFFSNLWNAIKSGVSGIGQFFASLFTGAANVVRSAWAGISSFFAGIWNGIKAVFSGVGAFFSGIFSGAAGVISGIWNGIKATLSGIWNGIKAVAATVWNGITTAIGSAAQGVSSVLSGIWNGVKSVVTGIWNAIRTAATTVWTGITTAIGNAASGVSSTLSSVWNGAKSVVTGIWNAIKSVAITVWTGITTAIGNAARGVSSVLSSIWNGVKGVVTGIWNAIKAAASSIWNGITTAVSTAASAVTGKLSTIWNAAKSAVMNIWNGLKGAASSAWNAITNAVTQAANSAKAKLSSAWNAIKSTVTSAWNALKSAATSVWNGITTAVTNAANSAKSKLTSAWNAIKSAVTNVWNNLKSAASTVWNGITTAISNAVNSAKSKVQSAWNAIKSSISSIWNNLKSAASSVWNGITSTISNAVNSAKSKIVSIWNSITSTLSGIWNNIKSKAVSAFQNIGSSIVSTLSSLPSKLLSIGSNIVSGLWSGISGKAGWLMGKIKDFAKGVIDKLKGALGIHSPSKLTEWMGKMIDEGFASGVTKNMSKVEKAMIPLFSDRDAASIVSRMEGVASARGGKLAEHAVGTQSQSQAIMGLSGIPTAKDIAHEIWDQAPELDVDIDGEKAGTILEPIISRRQASKAMKQNRRDGLAPVV